MQADVSGDSLLSSGWVRQDTGLPHVGCSWGEGPRDQALPHVRGPGAAVALEGVCVNPESGGEPGAWGTPTPDFSRGCRAFPCRFWSLLTRYLPTHSICSLPFVTSFCPGMGTRRIRYGQVRTSPRRGRRAVGLPTGPRGGEGAACPHVLGLAWASEGTAGVPLPRQAEPASSPGFVLQEEASGPWYHPGAQELQPLFGDHKLEGDGRGWVRTQVCLADAWNGGGSLLIRGSIPPEVGQVAVR